MPWYLWSITASLSVIVVEYLNRTVGVGRSFWSILPYTIVPIALAQAALHGSWSRAPTIFVAWVCFSLGTATTRIVMATYALGEVPSATTLAGIALMLGGAFLVKAG